MLSEFSTELLSGDTLVSEKEKKKSHQPEFNLRVAQPS